MFFSPLQIYPSEFGKERMKEEDLKGPAEFQQIKREVKFDEETEDKDPDDSDNDEGSDYHREKMRKYQLNRLRFVKSKIGFICQVWSLSPT